MNKAVVDVMELGLQSDQPDQSCPQIEVREQPRCRSKKLDNQSLLNCLRRAAAEPSGVVDLGGAEVILSEPLGFGHSGLEGGGKLTVRNGRIVCSTSENWDPIHQQSSASYTPSNPLVLSNVAAIASIPIGALVEGPGVGREVYVVDRRLEAGELTLSQPLWDGAANQIYGFTIFRYALDFMNLRSQSLQLVDLEIDCGQVASAVRLPQGDVAATLRRCAITRIRDRGVTTVSSACHGLCLADCLIDGDGDDACALNGQTDGITLQRCRFATSVVLNGRGHRVSECDLEGNLILSAPSTGTILQGNRFLGSSVELTDEHCLPNGSGEPAGFGSVAMTSNLFSVKDPDEDFRWIVLRPHIAGSVLSGLSIVGNTFAAAGKPVHRAEGVDNACAMLDLSRTHAVEIVGNVFDNVLRPARNPVTLEFDQDAPASVWTLNFGDHLPFGGHARTVPSLAPSARIVSSDQAQLHVMPSVSGSAGPRHAYVKLVWPQPCSGRVVVTARIDRAA